jgi:hypothetical protein
MLPAPRQCVPNGAEWSQDMAEEHIDDDEDETFTH